MDDRVKIKENKKRDKYLELARELRKPREYDSDVDTNYCRGTWYDPKNLIKNWKGWKSEDEPRPSKLKHCWGRPEY